VFPDKLRFHCVENDFAGTDAPDSLFRVQDLHLFRFAMAKQFLGKLRQSDMSQSAGTSRHIE
jgi:hypothetical protein